MPSLVGSVLAQLGIEWEYVKRKIVSLPKKRRVSFITAHYLYLLAWTIAGSVMIYPASGIAYIDALFFASGCATQSGLNTVDVNLLSTYQQIVMYMMTMFCTPIFINTFVVFVRLYWFEKRFQGIVKDARESRASRTRSMSRSKGKDEGTEDKAERGVNGRQITVLRNEGRVIGPAFEVDEKNFNGESVPARSSSSSDVGPRDETIDGDLNSTGAVQVLDGRRKSSAADESRRIDNERHITFLMEQRNPKNKNVLRIPGPREADQGAVPEELAVEDSGDETERPAGILKPRSETNSLSIRPNIMFEEPPRPLHDAPTGGKSLHRRAPSNPYALRSPHSQDSRPNGHTFEGSKGPSRSELGRSGAQEPLQNTVSYLSWQPTVGRNSTFFDLTEEQREELGGIEYRSLKTLAVTLVFFYIGFHLMGVIILVPWILLTDEWGQVVDADGQNRTWWGIFSSATFFNDLGFTLTPDSFISFQTSVLVMLLGSYLIVIGNTGFPCMLRFVVWVQSKLTREDSPLHEELRFLLDHPRRCFTLMFPSTATWVLFGILVVLNGIDLIFFIILDINDSTVDSLPPGYRVLDGLFQAFSTRTAGTACVNIADLHPGIQVSYLVMMYISVFPIAISVRRTNVYEERSLGVYSTQADEEIDEKEPSYIGSHLRRQLSFDLWFIFLGMFIIAVAEGGRIADVNEPDFTLFAVLFEIVSAYGTVGLSLGYPSINASFSAEFSVISKLVIIAMQIRGRHRGLPYELDRAISLPSESMHRKEEEDAERRGARRSSVTGADPNEDSVGPLQSLQSHPTQASGTAYTSGRDMVQRGSTQSETQGTVARKPFAVTRGIGSLVAAIVNPTPPAPRSSKTRTNSMATYRSAG